MLQFLFSNATYRLSQNRTKWMCKHLYYVINCYFSKQKLKEIKELILNFQLEKNIGEHLKLKWKLKVHFLFPISIWILKTRKKRSWRIRMIFKSRKTNYWLGKNSVYDTRVDSHW